MYQQPQHRQALPNGKLSLNSLFYCLHALTDIVDIYTSHGVVFQDHSVGHFWSLNFPILWGIVFLSEDRSLVLHFEALNPTSNLSWGTQAYLGSYFLFILCHC